MDRRTPGQKLLDAAEEFYEAVHDLIFTNTDETKAKRIAKHEQKQQKRAESFTYSRGRPRFSESLPVQERLQPTRIKSDRPGPNINGRPRFSPSIPTQHIDLNSEDLLTTKAAGRPRFSNKIPTQRC